MGLIPAIFDKWAVAVIVCPSGPTAGFCVANKINGHEATLLEAE
jgi:hypothetical protein